MSSTVQKIKERLSIADVIASYIDIEKSGGSLKAKCPFHNEKTPSFFISPDRGTFYCFGCGAKGDIFSFVQDFERVDFVTSLKMLAEKAGVKLEKFSQEEDRNGRLFEVMEEAANFFVDNLKSENDALIYLQKRKLKIEMVRDWKVGFAKEAWRSLKEHLKNKGFTEKEMLEAGLIKENSKEKNAESYDRFRGRIMFPIFDSAGRVIAFSGRLLKDKENEPKYLNSPDTPLFDKSRALYGYHIAKKAIREKGCAVLVEGQMDLLLSQQAGLNNTVASSGTALSPEHLVSLKRLTDTLVVAYDADNAGRNATFRVWKLALSSGFDLRAALLPDGLDPADAVAKDESIWKEAVKNSVNIVDYFLESSKGESNEKVADTIVKEKVLPLIKSIESNITKSRFIQKTSFATGIAENALWEELEKIKEDGEAKIEIPQALSRKEASGSLRAAGFLLWLKSLKNSYLEQFEKELLRIDPDAVKDEYISESEKETLIFESEMHYAGESDLKRVGEDILRHLEEELLKKNLTAAMERLKRAEAMHDAVAVDQELALCQNLSGKLSKLIRT